MIEERSVKISPSLPVRAGWHRLAISGLAGEEPVELRLDFGLGFVGHHALRATALGGQVELFVRLFKQLQSLQLRRAEQRSGQGRPEVLFRRVGSVEIVARRLAEQVHLIRREAKAVFKRPPSRHDRPRRLWRWRGFQAFPTNLPAVGESSYALWRRVRPVERQVLSESDYPDWLIVTCVDPGTLADKLRKLSDGKKWILLAGSDVALDTHCLPALAAAAKEFPNSGVFYSDNDHSDANGRRFRPQMRTGFSLERLNSQDWLGSVIAIRTDVLPPNRGPQTSDEELSYSLSKEIAAKLGAEPFRHIPQVLYSRLVQPQAATMQVEPPKRGTGADGKRATIIIPTHNRGDLLKACIDSINARTASAKPEIIIYDNNSDDPGTLALIEDCASRHGCRVIRDELPFNYSRINNEAAAAAGGDVLIFLNNDTQVVSEDWIDRLGAIACEADVGCVGPLLLTPNGRIQHAGLVTGPGGVAAHVHEGLEPSEVDETLPIVTRDVSAVTGACMAIEKRKFLYSGGFDEKGLAVAFNDVDLCLRLERNGLRNVFVADVTMIHIGSATRDDDDFISGSDRFRAEFALMRERWGPRLDSDPFFPEQMRLTKSGPELRLA